MAITTIKCIYCGEQFEGDTVNAESTCPKCNKSFSTVRASKYYKSMENVVKEEKKIAYGEMYATADNLITEGEFYLKNGEFDEAKTRFLKALEITTIERRIYLGLVKVYTKNFTDYEDNLHFEYLNKAITYSTKQQKDEIRQIYKAYHSKRNLTSEEMALYNEEELIERKTNVENLLKDGIPRHYKAIKQFKVIKILLPIFAVIAVITAVLSFVINDQTAEMILTLIATALIITLFVFIINLSGTSAKIKLYDCALDLFDEHLKFNFDVLTQIKLFTLLEKFTVDYLNGSTPITLENSLGEISMLLNKSDSQTAINFTQKYKIMKKLIKEIEEDEIPTPEIIKDDE